MVTVFGVVIGLFGTWLFVCDKSNEFAFVLMLIGLLCLVVGSLL